MKCMRDKTVVKEVSDEEIGILVNEIAYKQHHEEQSDDFLEKVWIVKKWIRDKMKRTK